MNKICVVKQFKVKCVNRIRLYLYSVTDIRYVFCFHFLTENKIILIPSYVVSHPVEAGLPQRYSIIKQPYFNSCG